MFADFFGEYVIDFKPQLNKEKKIYCEGCVVKSILKKIIYLEVLAFFQLRP